MTKPALHVTASPHIRAADDTPTIMWSVVMSLVPVVGASLYFFGPSALLVILASCAGVLVVERFFGAAGSTSLGDGSAMITGILLGLTLPPGFPLWMAFIGGAFGMAFGKLIFGGLGQNIFNPALLGRAFLQAAFPVAITTWSVPAENWLSLRGDNLALPLMSPTLADGMAGATPLGLMKFEQISTELLPLFLGSTGGSIGETSTVLILLGGIYLAARNHLNWRIPVSIFLTVAVMAGGI
ncbi:MAG: RnfABCDGE type electron transport complex subunit D, partial [Deltaproteobacteria bacterium]|nr:RnfABCDGE type electron transport complex subunit D [Deltaproteobacteria bacterium]